MVTYDIVSGQKTVVVLSSKVVPLAVTSSGPFSRLSESGSGQSLSFATGLCYYYKKDPAGIVVASHALPQSDEFSYMKIQDVLTNSRAASLRAYSPLSIKIQAPYHGILPA